MKNAQVEDKTSVTKEKLDIDNEEVLSADSDIDDEEVLSADELKDINKTHVQIELVNLGGHTAKVLVFVVFMSVPWQTGPLKSGMDGEAFFPGAGWGGARPKIYWAGQGKGRERGQNMQGWEGPGRGPYCVYWLKSYAAEKEI